MSANSRRRNKLLRQQRREAELRNQTTQCADATPGTGDVDACPSSVEQPVAAETSEQPTVEEAPKFKPARKGAKRLLETAADELEQAEVEFLEEVLHTVRDAMTLHRKDVQERIQAAERGEPITRRWAVSPGIFEKLVAKALLVIEILLARRRANPDRKAGGTQALSA